MPLKSSLAQESSHWQTHSCLVGMSEHGPYLDAARVRLEAARRVLGGDPALDGTAIDADVLLPQAQVVQAPALSHVDLGMDQVHTAGEGHRAKRGA